VVEEEEEEIIATGTTEGTREEATKVTAVLTADDPTSIIDLRTEDRDVISEMMIDATLDSTVVVPDSSAEAVTAVIAVTALIATSPDTTVAKEDLDLLEEAERDLLPTKLVEVVHLMEEGSPPSERGTMVTATEGSSAHLAASTKKVTTPDLSEVDLLMISTEEKETTLAAALP